MTLHEATMALEHSIKFIDALKEQILSLKEQVRILSDIKISLEKSVAIQAETIVLLKQQIEQAKQINELK